MSFKLETIRYFQLTWSLSLLVSSPVIVYCSTAPDLPFNDFIAFYMTLLQSSTSTKVNSTEAFGGRGWWCDKVRVCCSHHDASSHRPILSWILRKEPLQHGSNSILHVLYVYNLKWHTAWKVIFKGANAHRNLEKALRVDYKFRDYNLVYGYNAVSIIDNDDLTFVDEKLPKIYTSLQSYPSLWYHTATTNFT